MLGGIVAVALLLPTGGAAAACNPAPASTSPAAPASRQTQAVKVIVRVLPCFGLPELRPANYLMSCADANASWKKVKWLSWGAKTALGTGYLYQNDCQPNCVSGQFRTYRETGPVGGDPDQEVRPSLLAGHVLLLGPG